MTLLERVWPGAPVGITLLDRARPAPAPPPTAVLPPAVQRTPAGVFFPVPGPRAAGVGSAAYTHTQAVPADLWIINHNLGFSPLVQTFTVGGQEIDGAVHHVSVNQSRVSFAGAIAGTARLV